MLIENKWIVYDSRDDVYYTGDDSGGDPVFESLNSRVRLYKNEKAAKSAVRHIEYSGSERAEFCKLKAVYIERENVPDVPGDVSDKPGARTAADKQLKLSEVREPVGWEEVYGFACPFESLSFLKVLDTHIRASEKLKERQYCKDSVRLGDFGKIMLCRKTVGEREIFGVLAADGKLYSAGLDGGAAALEKFCDEVRGYLLPRVKRGDERK